MRDHSKRFTLKEWSEDYVDRVIQLGEDCDKEIELEPAPDEDFRDPRMFPANATEDYMREFVRGVLIG